MNFSLPPPVIHDLYKYFVDTLIMGILLSFMMALVALLYACLDPAMGYYRAVLRNPGRLVVRVRSHVVQRNRAVLRETNSETNQIREQDFFHYHRPRRFALPMRYRTAQETERRQETLPLDPTASEQRRNSWENIYM